MATQLAPGDVLQGKFRIERIVGRGGMGVVFEATNMQLDQKVALKLLAAGGAEDPAVVDRFRHEAKAAARLKSEHVARVFDVGKDSQHGPYIVMEMLDGKTLAELLAETKRIQLHRAVEYVIDACEGLAEAHARGIVHQDVKPANLFLVLGSDGRPSIKLLDFGIATMRAKPLPDGSAAPEKDDGKSSAPSAGTPAYLAPEQLRGTTEIDHRADIWALGCVLFELLSGGRAWNSLRFTELVTSILEAPHAPMPPDLEGTIPFEISEAINRCLEKDPAKRYASTGELALVLLPFARRRAHGSVARAVAHVKAAGLDPKLEMPSSMPPRPSSVSQSDSMNLLTGSSGALKAPGVPAFSTGPAPASISAAAPAPAPDRKQKGLGVAILALLVVVLVVGGVVGMRILDRNRTPTVITVPAPSSPSSTSAAAADSVAILDTSRSSDPATPSASVSSSAVGLTLPPTRFRGEWRNRPRNGDASTSPVAPAGTPESEIRHNR